MHLDFGDADVPGSPDHLGVAVQAGFGDGHYGVFVERELVDGKLVVARAIVDFLVTAESAG